MSKNPADIFRQRAQTTKRDREKQARMTDAAASTTHETSESTSKGSEVNPDAAPKQQDKVTDMVMVAVRMTPAERTKLRVIAAQKGESIQEMVRAWVRSL